MTLGLGGAALAQTGGPGGGGAGGSGTGTSPGGGGGAGIGAGGQGGAGGVSSGIGRQDPGNRLRPPGGGGGGGFGGRGGGGFSGAGPSLDAREQGALLSLSFEGGTARDFIQAVRTAHQHTAGTSVNILAAPEVDSVSVNAVSLQSVSVPAALQLLDGLSAFDGSRIIRLDFKAIDPRFAGEEPIYNVRAVVGEAQLSGEGTRDISRVWTIAELIGDKHYSADDVLTAIEAALALHEAASSQPRIRFHEETGLIIARGQPVHLETIGDVIDQLLESRERAHEIAALGKDRIIDELERRVDMSQEYKQRMEQSRLEAETHAVRIESLSRDIERLEARLADKTREADVLRDEVTALRHELIRLQERLQDSDGSG